MKILIIGGTGILSSVIAADCVSAGHQVTIVTDGLGKMPEPEGIERHLIIDRCDGVKIRSELSKISPPTWDLVVDSICYNDNQASSLFSAINQKSKHTIVISTAILYDRRNALPIDADSSIASPKELGEYGVGKMKMEQFWLDVAKKHRHPVTIFRLPHILGRGCDLGVLPLHNRDPQLIRRMLTKRPVILADGGRQLLQVVYNKDVAKVILAACDNRLTFGKIYNCANPEIISGVEYFEAIAHKLDVKLNTLNIPSEVVWETDWGWAPTTFSRVLDMTALQSDVGVVPHTNFKLAIEDSLSYILEHQSIDDHEIDYLDAIEVELEKCYSGIKKILSGCSRKRVRTTVDRRMNDDAPQFN